jgi:hypothetical protein
MAIDHKTPSEKAAYTARWAVTMTKVRIRQILSRTRWQLVTFCGKAGAESRGVVDMLAVRKDHHTQTGAVKRGDMLEIILIQVKGGSAAMPTAEDGKRLGVVAKRHHAKHVLLASWKKGTAVQFRQYRPRATEKSCEWGTVSDLEAVFR